MLCPLHRVFILALLVCVWPLRADITVAPLFGDFAVLQRDKVVPIWGTADVGEKLTVSFAGQRREATAGPDGRWIALLDPMPATAQGADLVIAGKNAFTFRDVVVGEVWLCSGQSNMEWPVARSDNAAQEIAAANFPLIRHVKINHTVSDLPATTVTTTGWQPVAPQTTGSFSAVAYYFARDVHQKLGVPIGLVNSSWGGTPVEAWMSPAAVGSNPVFAVVRTRWEQTLKDYPALQSTFETAQVAWTDGEAVARSKGKSAHDAFLKSTPRPRPPPGPGHPWAPTSLYNGMVNPLVPYALRGVLWYQGENNVDRPAEYHALFSAMITAWRSHFGQEELPFFWVNLASFRYPNDRTGQLCAWLREAQTKTLSLPHTGQAVAIDIGNPNDIHPTNKPEVGRRLALLARHRVYGFTGDDSGPTFLSATREGNGMRVRFAHVSGGLIAYHKPVQSQQLAGADRVFHTAEALLDRDTLFVSSRLVPEPVAVRYAWSNAPEANLYNGAGLPAVPFRSDDW